MRQGYGQIQMADDSLIMSDQKPYLLRAMFQWIVDNHCTPHLLIAYPGKGWVSGVPEQFLKNDVLVLNISPSASPDCVIEDDGVYFSARFSGQSRSVAVAMEAIAAIMAQETQQGMNFEISEEILSQGVKPVEKATSATETKAEAKQKSASHLKIIK